MRSIIAAPLAAVASIGFALGSPALAATSGQTGGSQSLSASMVGNNGASQANNGAGNSSENAAGAQQAGAGNSACLKHVQAFQTRMQKDGYWLNGYRGMGYGFFPAGPVVATGGAAHNNGNETTNAGSGPWGNVGTGRPGYDMRTLTAAAVILGRNGNEQTCETLLHNAQSIYKKYTAVLAQHGVNGPGVTKWRQAQIAKAKPVTQMQQNFRLQNINGMQVRNPQDKVLGSVNDVVLNPQSGKIAYLVISYGGGVFGIGSNNTAVPWQDFAATPGLNTLVLNTTEQALKNAPKVNPDQFDNGVATKKIDDQVNAYWQSHVNTNNRG